MEVAESKSSSGKSYVEDEMVGWPIDVQQNMLTKINRLERLGHGALLLSGEAKKFKGVRKAKLFELKERAGKEQYRVLFKVDKGRACLVIALHKGSPQSQLRAIETAAGRCC